MDGATPAQIANDMAAHGAYWEKRDSKISRTCRQAAAVIRLLLNGEHLDGRTWAGLHRRLLDLGSPNRGANIKGYPDLTRARLCIERLKRGRQS